MCTPLMSLTNILFPKRNIFHLPVQYSTYCRPSACAFWKCSDVSSVNAASCYVCLFLSLQRNEFPLPSSSLKAI